MPTSKANRDRDEATGDRPPLQEAASDRSSAPDQDHARRTPVHSAVVVLNARLERAARNGDLEPRVAHAFQRAGADVRVVVAHPEEVEAAVRHSLDQGHDLVFVGGGDGTLATAARVLRERSATLGVLPLGTRNHFARDLGIPLDLDRAVAALLGGRDAMVDLAEVNGMVFINNVSIGVYPRAVRRRARYQARLGLSKLTAMIYATLNVFWRHRLQRLRLRSDDRDVDLVTPLVLVGNNDYLLLAEAPARRGRLDAGLLSVFYTRAIGRFRLLWTAVRAMLTKVEDLEDLGKVLTRRIVVESQRPRIVVAIDGEVHELRPPLHFRSIPAGLRVQVPRAPS